MIEVYLEKKKGKKKLKGYIDDKRRFLNPRHKLMAYIKDDRVYFRNKPVFYIDENDGINVYERGILGYIHDFKISNSDGQLYYFFNKETGEVRDYRGDLIFELRGSLELIDKITFLGFCFAFLDLFC